MRPRARPRYGRWERSYRPEIVEAEEMETRKPYPLQAACGGLNRAEVIEMRRRARSVSAGNILYQGVVKIRMCVNRGVMRRGIGPVAHGLAAASRRPEARESCT